MGEVEAAFAAGMAANAREQAQMGDPMGGAVTFTPPPPFEEPVVLSEKGPDAGLGGVT